MESVSLLRQPVRLEVIETVLHLHYFCNNKIKATICLSHNQEATQTIVLVTIENNLKTIWKQINLNITNSPVIPSCILTLTTFWTYKTCKFSILFFPINKPNLKTLRLNCKLSKKFIIAPQTQQSCYIIQATSLSYVTFLIDAMKLSHLVLSKFHNKQPDWPWCFARNPVLVDRHPPLKLSKF